MFIDSSIVEIVESTVTGKKQGPRKRSTGHVIVNNIPFNTIIPIINKVVPRGTTTDSSRVIRYFYANSKRIWETKIQYLYYRVMPAEIYFNRFGLEQHSRNERKKVLLIFPIIDGPVPIKNVLPDKLLKDSLIKEIREDTGNCPLVVAVPFIGEFKSLFDDNAYFESFACSVLNNNLLKIACFAEKFIGLGAAQYEDPIYKTNKILSEMLHRRKELFVFLYDDASYHAALSKLRLTVEEAMALYTSKEALLRDLLQLKVWLHKMKINFFSFCQFDWASIQLMGAAANNLPEIDSITYHLMSRRYTNS